MVILPRFLLALAFGAVLPLTAAEIKPRPDPLITSDGPPIATVEAWAERRQDLLELFREHIYGRSPFTRISGIAYDVEEASAPAFDGMAVRHRALLRYNSSNSSATSAIRVTAYLPAGDAKPKGCFVLIVNRSRRIIDDAETAPREFWPARDIVERGYATVAFHYGDVATDKPETAFSSGVFAASGPAATPRAPDSWGAIAAWSLGISAVIDYLPQIPRLADTPIAVIGHSRGGKAALWCGAQDTRVALAISNDSGTTGAALARTTRGESIRRINEVFPHWFAPNYHAYADRAEELPVDQHMLLALIAPRLVYVASASEDANADPRAEFQACVWAAPVFALHGLAGVGAADFPAVGERRHEGAIGYHLRPGPHDLRREDWNHYLDYADRHLGVK